MAATRSISLIIPVYNEAAIAAFYLSRLPYQPNVEILVVDGGSGDATLEICRTFPVQVLLSPQPGRAHQMNYAARQARGDVLLFLHLDTQLPANFQLQIWQVLDQPRVVAGAFRFQVVCPGFKFRLLEQLVNWRSHWCGLPYGDQALFLEVKTFTAIGGFADLPIMEDYEIVQRLKTRGKIGLTQGAILTSGRRWQRLGFWHTTLLNQAIVLGYHTGITPAQLARWYRR
jgi:rSAM/selenodomain-associated transferase 2